MFKLNRHYWGPKKGSISHFPKIGLHVTVSCGYNTCFAVRPCDGLYHFIFSIKKSTKPILALNLSVSATITPGGLPHSLIHGGQCTLAMNLWRPYGSTWFYLKRKEKKVMQINRPVTGHWPNYAIIITLFDLCAHKGCP